MNSCPRMLALREKCPNTELFPGPYFPAFRLNTERYSIYLRIQCECGEIRTRKNSVFGRFSRSVIVPYYKLFNKA